MQIGALEADLIETLGIPLLNSGDSPNIRNPLDIRRRLDIDLNPEK
jgi:hypothetical protein